MILPSSHPSFEWTTTESGPALVCRPLAPFAIHVFTTRHWRLGHSESADEAGWDQVARALAVDEPHLVRVHQVHGAGVATVPLGRDSAADADIIVSDNPAFALAIRVADCVPLLIADRRSGAVAAAHAGWRGLQARVPAVAVRALTERYGTHPDDVIAAAGPSIGPCCYEVGPDVRLAFESAGFSAEYIARWFRREPEPSASNPSMPQLASIRRPGHFFFDGWRATRDQLVGAGVADEQIFTAETCTASHPSLFCSYRRDGQGAGRLVGVVRARTRG